MTAGELMEVTDRHQHVMIGTKRQLDKNDSALAGTVEDVLAFPDEIKNPVLEKEVVNIAHGEFIAKSYWTVITIKEEP